MSDIFKAIENQDLEELKTLLEGGADVNIQNEDGDTPVHFMCWEWSESELKIRAMELLLEHGANLNIQNRYGYTPLHLACLRCDEPELTIRAMELLLESGADVNIQNKNEDSSLDLAQKHNPNSKKTKILEEYISRVRVPTLRGLIIRKIRSRSGSAVPTEQGNVFEGIPKMCLEFPYEIQSSKEYTE